MKKVERLISRLALKIYGLYIENAADGATGARKKIEKEMSLLNPGTKADVLTKDYYIQKIVLVLYVVFAGAALIILIVVSELTSKSVNEDYSVARNEFGSGSQYYELIPRLDDYDYGIIDVEVNEIIPSGEELDGLIEEFYKALETIILDKNDSFDCIRNDLNLVTYVDGYPFTVRWELSNYDVMNENGELSEEKLEDGSIKTSIKAIISYGEIRREKEYSLTIFSKELTHDEKMMSALLEAIDKSNDDNPDKAVMYLPLEINGQEIHWEEKREHTAYLIMVLISVLILGVWRGKDIDLHKKYEERNQNLLDAYADIICELEMYLSAGLTIRGAIERIDRNYKKRINQSGQHEAAYEELAICVKRLRDGASEANCYEQWGYRCGLINYRKLASLLSQNLRKGTDGLITALENEMRIAFEERKAIIKKRGEEAQTKLLFPMMLMLSVVMIIIMIPAYLSFGI